MLVRIRYTAATGEKLINVTFGPKNIRRRIAGTEELHEVEIRNGRSSATQFSLDENGFVLVQHRTAVRDFFDKAELERVYYPEVSELIRSVSGAERVILFDHTLRSGEEAEREEKRHPRAAAPRRTMTTRNGPGRKRVRELMGEEAETLLKRRFAIIQVWRAINQPIESQSARNRATRRARPGRSPDRRATLSAPHRPDLSPEVQPEAPLVLFPAAWAATRRSFSRCSTAETDGRARFTPHTSFDDPTTPLGAPPRQSIEARALAFF